MTGWTLTLGVLVGGPYDGWDGQFDFPDMPLRIAVLLDPDDERRMWVERLDPGERAIDEAAEYRLDARVGDRVMYTYAPLFERYLQRLTGALA